MIIQVLEHYYPEWEPPEPRTGWQKIYCPSHQEDNPSASLNVELNAVNCFACGFSGDVISIIREEENCSYGEAFDTAKRIAEESNCTLPPEFGGQSGAGVSRGARSSRGKRRKAKSTKVRLRPFGG